MKGDKVFSDNIFDVFWLKDKSKCQALLNDSEMTGAKYTHCIGWYDSNQYDDYNNQGFTMYAIIHKPSMAKELENGTYVKPYADKWHMCIMMVRPYNGARTTDGKQYQVSDANNPGEDPRGNWDDMVGYNQYLSTLDNSSIIPRQDGDTPKHWLADTKEPFEDLEYKELSYNEKEDYIATLCNIKFQLTDMQFKHTPTKLKHAYIGKQIPLSDSQLETLKDDQRELKWYFVNLTRRWGHFLKDSLPTDVINDIESKFDKITIEGEPAEDIHDYIIDHLYLSPLNIDLLQRYSPKTFEMYQAIMSAWFKQNPIIPAKDNKFFWQVFGGKEGFEKMLWVRMVTGRFINRQLLTYAKNNVKQMYLDYTQRILNGTLLLYEISDTGAATEMEVARYLYKNINIFDEALKYFASHKDYKDNTILAKLKGKF